MNPINHVAIIMDGNGRWGLKHKGSRNQGHKAGLKTVENIIKTSINQHLVSDVPVGLFYSGGIDSSIILTETRSKIAPFTIKSSSAARPSRPLVRLITPSLRRCKVTSSEISSN